MSRDAVRRLMAAFACAFVGFAPVVAGAGEPSRPVALVAAPEHSFAQELTRELASADLNVRRFAASAGRLDVIAPEIRRVGIDRGAALTDDGGGLWLFALRGEGAVVEIAARIPVDPADWTARRRTWISAVEWLRVAPPLAAADTGENPERSTLAVTPARATASDRAAGVGATRAPSAAVIEDAPPAPTPEPPPSAPPSNWSLGAGTSIGTGPSVLEPTARALLIGRVAPGPHTAFWARLEWPLLGTLVEEQGGRARLWTFGIGTGVAFTLGRVSSALRPFVGAGTGFDMLLVADDRFVPSRGSGVEQFSVQGAGFGGVRVRLAARLELGFEITMGYGTRIGTGNPPGYSVVRARGAYGQGAVSLMFDF